MWELWANDEELTFEFIARDGKRHIIVTFSNAEGLAYTIRRGEKFEPGAHEDPVSIIREIKEAISLSPPHTE